MREVCLIKNRKFIIRDEVRSYHKFTTESIEKIYAECQ